MDKQKIVAIVGCTASGKTALSVELARRAKGEIVSCDSMQIYRGMDIGTAKPTYEERRGIPHHLIDIVDPEEDFSCADYARLADACISEIISRGKLPIVCGGTGLYLDGLLRGGSFEETETDPDFRAQMNEYALDFGTAALHEKLREVDPESAEAIHPNNVKRVIRALEIYHTTGRKKSELDKESRKPESKYDALVIGLRYPDREVLYERINKRVDQMVADGLAEETGKLYGAGVFERSKTAAQAIGYKELLPYFRGDATLDASVETLKLATRHYAKRQMTWFASKPYIKWIDVLPGMSFEDIVNISLNLFRSENICDIIN